MDISFSSQALCGWGSTKSAIRACHSDSCSTLRDEYYESYITNKDEFRPSWVEYDGGVVAIGKGGQDTAFLEWDAGAYHGRVPTTVYVGISTGKWRDGDWVFYDYCP